MTSVAPLSMSQTKDDLLKHLNMPLETYNLMAVSLLIPVPCNFSSPEIPISKLCLLTRLLTLFSAPEGDRSSLQVADQRPGPPKEKL